MAAVMVRSLPDKTHRALTFRTAEHGRSREAEIRHVLAAEVNPETRAKSGPKLSAFGSRFGDLDKRKAAR